jgi:hypothetical protein
MRRHFWMLVLGGLIGALALASDARACHHKKACAPAPCAPAPVCEPCVAPAPVCEPAPCPPPKSCCHGGLFKKHSLFCHKPKCEPAPCIVEPMAAPCAPTYTAWPSPQSGWAAPSGQGVMMSAPSKQGW